MEEESIQGIILSKALISTSIFDHAAIEPHQAPIFFKANDASVRTPSSGSSRALRKDGTALLASAPMSPSAAAACLRSAEAAGSGWRRLLPSSTSMSTG